MKLNFVLWAVLGSFLIGCSTASVRVMPGKKKHRVVSRDIERDSAEEEAVKAANKYCEDRGAEAYFLKDKTAYTGDMDEKTRKTIRKGSKAATWLGSGLYGLSSEKGAGAVLGGAGMVGTVMTSDRDYKATVDFKCRRYVKVKKKKKRRVRRKVVR